MCVVFFRLHTQQILRIGRFGSVYVKFVYQQTLQESLTVSVFASKFLAFVRARIVCECSRPRSVRLIGSKSHPPAEGFIVNIVMWY